MILGSVVVKSGPNNRIRDFSEGRLVKKRTDTEWEVSLSETRLSETDEKGECHFRFQEYCRTIGVYYMVIREDGVGDDGEGNV